MALIIMPRSSDKFFGNTPFPVENILYTGLAAFILCLSAAVIKYQTHEGEKPAFAVSSQATPADVHTR